VEVDRAKALSPEKKRSREGNDGGSNEESREDKDRECRETPHVIVSLIRKRDDTRSRRTR